MENIDYIIGDDIVAIENHSQNAFKKLDTFKCLGLRLSQCKCSGYEVNIGIFANRNEYNNIMACNVCGYESQIEISSAWWLNASYFRSIDKISISEVYEQLEKQPFEV